jgi:hypothetical protein
MSSYKLSNEDEMPKLTEWKHPEGKPVVTSDNNQLQSQKRLVLNWLLFSSGCNWVMPSLYVSCSQLTFIASNAMAK